MRPNVGWGKFENFADKGHEGCCKSLQLLLCIGADSVVEDTDESVDVAELVGLWEVGVGIRVLMWFVIVDYAEVQESVDKIGHGWLEDWRG